MLTKDERTEIERQQNQAMKNILGLGISASKMRAELGLDNLEARRERSLESFATRCAGSRRFGHWFECRPSPLYNRRVGVNYRQYLEKKCRTERNFNSPLNAMRRKLNAMNSMSMRLVFF